MSVWKIIKLCQKEKEENVRMKTIFMKQIQEGYWKKPKGSVGDCTLMRTSGHSISKVFHSTRH